MVYRIPHIAVTYRTSTAEDHNGNRPLKLAEGRKHWEIVSYLNRSLKRQSSILPQFDMSILLFGPPGKSKLQGVQKYYENMTNKSYLSS